MPNMCGVEATKRIRRLGYTGLIVGVTGNIYVMLLYINTLYKYIVCIYACIV